MPTPMKYMTSEMAWRGISMAMPSIKTNIDAKMMRNPVKNNLGLPCDAIQHILYLIKHLHETGDMKRFTEYPRDREIDDIHNI